MRKIYIFIIFLVAAFFLLFTGLKLGWFSKNKAPSEAVVKQEIPASVNPEVTAPSSDVNAENSGESIPAVPPAPTDNTAPEKTAGITFAVIGDTKTFSASPNGNLEKAVRSLSKQNLDLAFVMGDLVSSCDGGSSCEKKYESWKNIMSPILAKTYEVQGNHDRTGGNAADAVWQKEFNLPTNGPAGYEELAYSFDKGNLHFVVLTSEKPKGNAVNDVQRSWLEKDLAANTQKNTFVFFHEPAFQMSQDAKDALDANPQERDQLWNILKKYKVTAVFNGHLHMIARKLQDGIYQFVIGDTDSTADDVPQKNLTDFGLTGHHYAIVSVSGQTVDVKIYSLDGNLENDYSFSK